jgi:hypothetical protein
LELVGIGIGIGLELVGIGIGIGLELVRIGQNWLELVKLLWTRYGLRMEFV